MHPSKALPYAAILLLSLGTCVRLCADPLSRKADIDFYSNVPSRDLHGLAARSDGRLVAGPVLTDLKGKAPSELLWCLAPGQGGKWIVGGGPGGRIIEVTLDTAAGTFGSREVVSLGDVQVYALRTLPDGSILAGTTPGGGLSLVRDGKVVARSSLPAAAVFDIDMDPSGSRALVATGNPGRIYSVDLRTFSAAGVSKAKDPDPKDLASHGITLFGEISDHNVRRIARLSDGRVAAGSAPKGNVYVFPAAGGQAYLVEENHDAEVTDILADSKGGYYAAIVFNGGEIHPIQTTVQVNTQQEQGQLQISPTPSPAQGQGTGGGKAAETTVEILNPNAQPERFQGRSSLQWFSTEGFPEVLTSRSNAAFYRICRHGDLLVLSGGELGEMFGFDLDERLALTFEGSASAQVNALEPIPGSPDRFLAIRNNAPGLALLDFASPNGRTATTKRIDLGNTARLGAIRFNRIREITPSQLSLSVRTTNASGETDGWSPWTEMKDADGWRADVPAGRYIELKLSLPSGTSPLLQLDAASAYFLTQNHRPQLQEFRFLSPNYAIVVPPEAPAPVVTTVGQLIQAGEHDSDHRHSSFQGSQVVASPGTRVAFWTVNDVDGDNLLYTFSIRRDGDPKWTDILVDSADSYVQFDTLHLEEGTWFTRLVAREAAPRPAGERLSVTFETDDLVVDHTPPVIEDCTLTREGGRVTVTVRGRDQLSLLAGAEFTFNNGVHATVEQPADGILDGKEESFMLELPESKLSGATSVEVTLYDAAENGATRRLSF